MESSLWKSTSCLNIKLIVWLILFRFHSAIFFKCLLSILFISLILERFVKYINESKYNTNQIEFIYLIIENIHRNGFIKDRSILSKPQFSNYSGIMNLFPKDKAYEIVDIINSFPISD